MPVSRRELLTSLIAGALAGSARPLGALALQAPAPIGNPLRTAGAVDWREVRRLFPLAPDWTHFASFLFVSHPRPVAEAIESFRRKIDADPFWIELAALTDSEGRPFAAVKRALAGYIGGEPSEICLTSNTTSALAMAYHGLRMRADQEVLTTEHDHYSHHESIRLACERSGSMVRRVALYDSGAAADANQMVERVERAIRPNTRALGVTWVHSSTGVKLPLAALAEAVARANRGRADADRCFLVVDGVHGFANQDVDVARLGCDFFATGTHKWLFAPRGTGFLWGRSDAWPQMRPTIPTFDPDALAATWGAWMEQSPMPRTEASFVSPGGFLAYEYFLAIPAAVELHRSIGRTLIADRIAELNAMFREGAARIQGVTLHTPRDRSLSAGISSFEVRGLSADQVTQRLAQRRIRATTSPYKVSYARIAAGIMNLPDEIDAVLGELRAMSG